MVNIKKQVKKDTTCEKQELTIADQLGSILLVLWGSKCKNKVEEGNTYIHIYLQISNIFQID